MRKTILREYLFFLFLCIALSTLLLGNLLGNFSYKNFKNSIEIMTKIVAKNVENLPEEEIYTKVKQINSLLSSQNIKINFSNNANRGFLSKIKRDYNSLNPVTQKNFMSFGKYLVKTKFITSNELFIFEVSSIFKCLKIYFYIFIILTFLNILIAIFYVRSLKNNIILPLKNISKHMFKESNKNFSYKFEEIENLNFYTHIAKKELKNSIYFLKNENRKIDYVLDNMSEGFILINSNLTVLAINKNAKKILSTTQEAGKNIFYYTQNIKFIKNIENSIKDNRKIVFDLFLNSKKIYSVYINKIKFKKDKKFLKEYIILIVDVTENRINQKLRQEFFTNISHELKTPITSIKGYVELIQKEFVKSKAQKKEFLCRIEKEVENMTQLINDISTISKLQNEKIPLNVTEFNFNILINEIIKSFVPMCIENSITIQNLCNDFIIKANYKHFFHLFSNLILNAIKYNKENGYVKIYCKESENNIEFIVEDSGIGIAPENRNRIFERFYRVEKGRNKETGGTGLGLSIVKYIVKLYRGEVKVKSKIEIGSTFIVRIPKKNLI